MPAVSIIIATYNGSGRIPALLSSLEKQVFKDFEVIVVIDGSTDNTKEVVNGFSARFAQFRILEQSQNKGRPSCINDGVKLANGRVLIFFDDDMVLEEQCVQQHWTYHQNSRKDGILVGNGYRNPEWAKNDFDRYLISVEDEWRSTHEKEFSVSFENFIITTCNLSMPKAIFEELGGFDRRLYDCEDVDLAVKALNRNIGIFYSCRIPAWHNDFPSLQKYVRRMSQYHFAKQRLVELYPEYPGHLPGRFDNPKPPPLKKWILGIFRNSFFLSSDRMIGKLFFLPQKIRFYIYRITISAHSEPNK